MTQKKSWSELKPRERKAIAVTGVLQLALLAAALTDLARRPQSGIRGKKPAWVAASFINFAGPLAYFLFGRR